MTLLDKYVIGCFVLLFAILCENALMAHLAANLTGSAVNLHKNSSSVTSETPLEMWHNVASDPYDVVWYDKLAYTTIWIIWFMLHVVVAIYVRWQNRKYAATNGNPVPRAQSRPLESWYLQYEQQLQSLCVVSLPSVYAL